MKKLLVLLAAVAFVVAFTVPAMSADKAEWSFYGNARMATFYDDVEPEGGEGDTDLQWDLQGNSRIGAAVKAGDIGGGFEYGTGINLRKIYGTWNFGGGSLLVGQTYTPLDYFSSGQVKDDDTGLIGYGTSYTGRLPQIKLNIAGLELALIKPNTLAVTKASTAWDDCASCTAAPGTVFDDTDTSLPKLEVAYKINLGSAHIKILGGFQTYDLVVGGKELSLDSLVYGFGVTAPFGPAYFKGSLLAGKNAGNLGIAGAGTATASATEIVDNDTLAYTAVLGFKASDMISFELGYGHIENEDDVSGAPKTEADAYYAQAVINIAKGFFVVPEVGKFDKKDTKETTYYGAKWQINF